MLKPNVDGRLTRLDFDPVIFSTMQCVQGLEILDNKTFTPMQHVSVG